MSHRRNAETITSTIPKKVLWGYGASGYATSIFYLTFIFYGMFYFTDVIGIAPSIAGMIISIGVVWDALNDPLIGRWTDNRSPEKGRRRPFLLWMTVPLTAFAFLSFYNPGFSNPTFTVIYFVAVVLGAYLCQTMVDIPYTALAAEITSNYDERSRLNFCRNIFWNAAMLMSCAFLFVVDYFTAATGGSIDKGFAFASFICMAPIAIFLLLTYYSTKGYESHNIVVIKESSIHKKNKVAIALKNKSFVFITIVFSISIIGQAMNNVVALYYYLNNLGLSMALTSGLFIFSAVNGFGDSWLASRISSKLSKKAAWAICMGSWAFSSLVFVMFILGPNSPVWVIGLFIVFNALGLNTQYQLAYSMIPDCIEVDEFKVGERNEGIYYGMISLVQKLCAAITMAICGVVLGLIGYDGLALSQTPEALQGLKMIYGLGCGLCFVLSIIINMFNPMSRTRHQALVKAIANKREGKEYDTSQFKALL